MHDPGGQQSREGSRPSTSDFLRNVQIDPQAAYYKVNEIVVSQLHRSLWTYILSQVSPAHFLPREIAPTLIHALVFLERCNWKLCDAQKRAMVELNERRREKLGGVASSASSSSSSSTSMSSSQGTRSMKGKFVPPRLATPPPGASIADDLGPEYGDEKRGMPCGHVFRKGEAIYRCRDCALDDTCVLCAPCFNASNHEGHDIVFSVSNTSGGCCDCGDEEAWTSRICCKYHDFTGDEQDPNFTSAPGPSGQIESLLKTVPRDVKECIISSVSTMFAYVLDTMEHAPMEMKLPQGPDAIERIKAQPTLEPAVDESAEGDQDDRARIYSVVLWNDEKHSFKEVIDTVSGATEKAEFVAKGIAERVDKHGRDIIETSGEVKKMYLLAHKLSQIDLAVTVRPAYDIFAEEVAGHVLDFLLDLTNASLFVAPSDPSSQIISKHHLDQMIPNAAAMRALIGRALFEPWRHRKEVSSGQMSQDYFDSRALLQLDGLLLLDNRMWKEARSTCRSIYMALLGPREVKRALAFRFAKMYSKLVEIFIIHDREPDHSSRIVTVQLFSVPSIASELVADLDLLYSMCQILQSIFTGQLTTEHLTLPPTAPTKMRATPSSLFMRQQRCYHIFFDIRYLLSAQGVQTQLVQNSRHLTYFLDFLALFNAITPDRRAITEHIEFESDVWVQIFHIATHLARSAKLFGEAYVKASCHELDRALNLAMSMTLQSSMNLHRNDPDIHSAITFHQVTYADASFLVIDFAVETLGVSFHHPMHWLLAEMLKHVHKIDHHYLQTLARPFLREMITADMDDDRLMTVFEFPLRVVVKLAQIRSGMWVRNGFGIRSQAHHYRDNSMRDLMYDQDFFLLQMSLVFLPASRMLVNMIHRFSLGEWMQSNTGEEDLEQSQRLFLAEEFLLLLVHLLSETSIATNWSMEKQVRREVIHFLALNQGTYSELTRHISERLKEHSSFDRILAVVSSFRAPDGTHDLGIFELKDECFDEVQPYFFHYTRNQREKAEEVLKERQKRKASAQVAETFAVVPERRLQSGQAVVIDELRQVFKSPVLHQIIFHSLYNAQNRIQETADNLIDAALQLLMMGLIEEEESFAVDMHKTMKKDVSILTFLLKIRRGNDKFTGFKAKIDWIIAKSASLNKLNELKVLEMDEQQGRANVRIAATGESVEERKRAAAKERQAAIMQQFSAQQKSLLESLEGDLEDEYDDGLDEGDEDGDALMSLSHGAKQEQQQHLRPLGTCIFCQEQLDYTEAFGSLAHIQSSRVMRTTPRHDAFSLQQSLQTPLTLDRNEAKGKRVRGDTFTNPGTQKDNSQRRWDGFPSEDHRFGFNATTCGHLMHLTCFDNYCRNVEQRHAQQIARNHPEDLSKSEFVCPLCKSLGNVILPVPKSNLMTNAGPFQVDETTISDWIRKINIDILKTSTTAQNSQMQESEHGTGSFLPWYAEDAQALLDSWLNNPVRSNLNIPLATRQMLERLIRVLKPLSNKSRSMRSAYQTRTILAPPSRKMYIPEEVIAYTISMLEISQRGSTPVKKDDVDPAVPKAVEEPLHVADGVNIHTRELVQSLILSLRDIAKMDDENYQSTMRHGLLMRLLPHWGGHDTVRSPLLLRNPLTILIEASIIVPENLHQITVLMFYVHLIQVVFGLAQPSIWPQNGHSHLNDMDVLYHCFDDVRVTVGNIIGLVGYARGNITLGVDNLDDVSLAKIICTYCLPFLRRATILQKSMGVLRAGSGSGNSQDSVMMEEGGGMEEKGEFLRLMSLLDIPLPKEALPVQSTRQTALAGLVEGWIKHAYPQLASIFRPLPIQPSPLSSHQQHHPTLQLEHPHIYELIQLPSDLTMLLMQCQILRCKRCGNLPPEPAICLECGELLCFQSFCCQGPVDDKGECNRHMEECGHSSGIFFRVKSNIIILLYQGNGCFTYSPYLDTHGEIDIGLKKGKIQFLHPVRFDELRKQWLSHGFANIITRKIEAVIDQGGWETM
ncbi:hypothetical protein CBS101457_003749 [Exobasidium rhododendri]|nr:hypothetical protein CBS101457_003749 [Exobasidium rhododendri]